MRHAIIACALVVFLWSGPSFAQAPASPADKPPAATKSAGVEFHGSIRSRLEMWDWFGDTDAGSYAYSGNIVKLSASKTGRNMNWKVELAAPILLGLPDDAIEAGARGQLGLGATYYAANHRDQNAAMIFAKQAYLEFHHLGPAGQHGIKAGRFEFLDGSELTPKNATLAALKRTRVNQRLIGAFGFSHTGRSFDGAQYSWNGKTSNVTIVGATPTRGVFQVDGWGWNRVGFAYGSYSRGFSANKHASEFRVFSIFYKDFRDVLKTDNRPLSERLADGDGVNIQSFGGHFVHATETAAGTVDLLAWGVGQTGSWGRADHRAGAVVLEGGYQPRGIAALKPWLRAGYTHSSGDNDPTDGKHRTFFQVLPTVRPFAKFPFFNMMNNDDRYVMLTLRPHAKLNITSDLHALRLSARNDFWYGGGGVFQPWTFGYTGRATEGQRSLATLADIGAALTLHKQFAIEAYYGYANGKSVMRQIYPDGKNGSFGYLEATYTF
ncbi:MAG: alginate export family protein [Bryobacterales bacterium]|nr:alginate export family protein [Bryobacterales bacterium]